MNSDHVKENISAFLNNELTQTEKKLVAEHLMLCEACRKEHDEAKLGALLAGRLPSADAPEAIWTDILASLEHRGGLRLGLIPQAAWFSVRKGLAFAAAVAIVSIVSALVYLNLFSGDAPQVADVHETGPQGAAPSGIPLPANTEDPVPISNSNIQIGTNTNTDANIQNSNSTVNPPTTLPSWQVETIAGNPKIADGTAAAQIAVGQFLETDGKSKAKITVADIGSVEIAPNSRVKLVGTSDAEHRLALERGQIHAKIFAPPRLFIVDTPSGKAVDLGCEYTLEVDRAGNSILKVSTGFVALEDNGRESIVPAGMMCLTKKGRGLGTPFANETNPELRRALEHFDFAGGGSVAVNSLLAKADFYDMVTLWHLLKRVARNDRGAVFDKLAKFVAPPAGVTRDGIIGLDKKMLEAWKGEVETAWFN
jgi:hypothetical protein